MVLDIDDVVMKILEK